MKGLSPSVPTSLVPIEMGCVFPALHHWFSNCVSDHKNLEGGGLCPAHPHHPLSTPCHPMNYLEKEATSALGSDSLICPSGSEHSSHPSPWPVLTSPFIRTLPKHCPLWEGWWGTHEQSPPLTNASADSWTLFYKPWSPRRGDGQSRRTLRGKSFPKDSMGCHVHMGDCGGLQSLTVVPVPGCAPQAQQAASLNSIFLTYKRETIIMLLPCSTVSIQVEHCALWVRTAPWNQGHISLHLRYPEGVEGILSCF